MLTITLFAKIDLTISHQGIAKCTLFHKSSWEFFSMN
jgi:hypothetical protein